MDLKSRSCPVTLSISLGNLAKATTKISRAVKLATSSAIVVAGRAIARGSILIEINHARQS